MEEEDFEGDSGGLSQVTPAQRPPEECVNDAVASVIEKQMAVAAIEDSRRQLGRLERIIAEAQ